VIENNKVIWSKGYGVMDEETKEPVTPLPFFRPAASATVAAYTALKVWKKEKSVSTPRE